MIKRLWLRGILYTICGLCVGHYLFKPLTHEQKFFALVGAAATGVPLAVSARESSRGPDKG